MAEEEELELGEMDYEEETGGFPPPERRIVTQAYDLSVSTLVEQWDDDILIVPSLQREYVWDRGRASRLVESLMLNIPIPPVFFAETPEAKYEIIDGHQRVASIVSYVKNEFPLSSLRLQKENTRLRFHQLPSREQRFLMTRVMRAIIISVESHPTMKFEIFQRLNSGSISLNAQEIRNALNQGSLNDVLHALARGSSFRRCIGTKTPRKRMVDEELALRFVALRHGLANYRPPLLRFLNQFMEADWEQEDLDEFSLAFRQAADFTSRSFPKGGFRVTNARGEPTERNVNRALFDAQMLAASWVQDHDLRANTFSEIRRKAADLYLDEEFSDAMRLATGDRRRTVLRILMYARMLDAVGVPIAIPTLTA